jgi:hypothetical protein
MTASQEMALDVASTKGIGTAGTSPLDTVRAVRSKWLNWAGTLFSVAILGAALWHLRHFDLSSVVRIGSASKEFWALFLVYYLAGPLSEFIIFRKLWAIPFSGMIPLLRKQVSNELLLGYSGEVYFYSWARRAANLTTSPFGAVKDVTILSAMIGNAVTILLLIVSAPLLTQLLPRMNESGDSRTIIASFVFIMASSLVVLFYRKKLFSLDWREIRFVSLIHFARIVVTIGLSALLWHLLLPSAQLGWWLLLSTWRQLIARLPFIANKDVVFAAAAVFLIGRDHEIGEMLTFIAALIVAAHILVGIALAAEYLIRKADR